MATSEDDGANTYLRVAWQDTRADAPVTLYLELDEDRWEVRKVEVFADGRTSCAEGRSSSGETRLSDAPIPPIDEIAKDARFEPTRITRAEFETIWERASRST